MSAGSSPRETLTMKLRISASLLYVTSIILIISCANIQSAVADDANAPCTTANDNPFGFCADTTPGGVNANAWKNAHKELPSSDPNVPPPTVNDRRAKMTAEATPAASSQPFKRCVEVLSGRLPTVRLSLMMPLPFGASFPPTLRVGQIRTRDVFPPRTTSSTWPPPSSTLTVLACTNDL